MNPDIREEIIDKYNKGKSFIDQQGIVENTRKNWRFYLGDQWYGLETGGEVLPQYNVIKPTLKYKITTVCQNKMSVTYSDLQAQDKNVEIFKAMNIKVASNWEKADMSSILFKVIKEAGISGDSYTFWYEPNKCQQIDNVSIILGDEQNSNIQEQPWIIIRERVNVSDVIEVAKANHVPEEEWSSITADKDNDYQLDKDTEVDGGSTDGKCLSLIYMTKETEKDADGKETSTVWVGRCTKNCMYQPMTAIRYSQGEVAKRGLTMYPIVNFVWEDKPNSARGYSEVEQLIPNQIQINRLLAQRAIAIKQCAFPKLAYDVTAVNNPEDIDTIGASIQLNGNAQAINSMITYLSPAGLNGEGTALNGEMVKTTRELAGASENILGQIDPTRVAASAIAALQEQSASILNEQVAKFEKYIEDTARLWWELDIVYNDTVETQDTDGNPIKVTPDEMSKLQPEVRIDVSQDTAFTKESALVRMDKLLEMQQITVEEWAKLLPQNSPLPKDDLLRILQERQQQMPPEEEQPMQAEPIPQEQLPLEERMALQEGGEYGMPEM